MVIQRTAFLLSVMLVANVVNAADVPEPVTIRVVDKETGEPVKRFTYDYDIDSPDRHDFPVSRDAVEAVTEDGLIRIPAPGRCSLRVCATTPWHFPRNCREFKILPDDRKRTFTLEILRGATVRGVVKDAETYKPLAGARVSPRYFGHPSAWIDGSRAVETDANGRFVIGGVSKSFGVCVERQGYETINGSSVFEARLKVNTSGDNTFYLKRKQANDTGGEQAREEVKPHLFGSVVDDRNGPVGPYRIVAAAMHASDALIGNKEYYFAEEVADVPAGKPWELTLYSDAKLYWIMAEAPGFAPTVRVVRHEEIDLPIHLRLRPGFSLSGTVEGPGVADGKAVAMVQPMYLFDTNPPHQHHHESPLHCVQARRVDLKPDGRFALDHLGVGTWLLQVVAAGATPIERLITFRDSNVRLEEPLKLEASGRIEGIIHDRDGELMVMESCHWSPPETIDPKVGEAIWGRYFSTGTGVGFTTDEQGRFVLENAPVGQTRVGFAYRTLINHFDHHDHLVNVLPGRTTEVRINMPKDSKACWKLPIEVVVGDGSLEAMVAGCSITNPKFYHPPKWEDPRRLGFSLTVEPLPGQAVSWPSGAGLPEVPFDGLERSVLIGIHPGKYRLMNAQSRWKRCCDLQEAFVDQAVDIRSVMERPVQIRLPDASVRVDLEHPEQDVRRWSVCLMALDEDGKLVRRQDTYCRAHNNTAPNMGPHLRFVPPGRYTLLAWRDLLGWARSEPVVVESGKIADAGRLVFQPGGTIRGRITLPQVSRRPRCVMAVDSHGVRVETESEWTHEGYTFEVKNLWPERWTIMAMDRDENVVTKRTVELNGTEIVETD